MSNRAVVVLSGGQDSTICLHWAMTHYKEVMAVTFNYGQTHSIELESARTITELNNIPHEILNIPEILRSTSPLTDTTQELETYDNYEEMDNIIRDNIKN